MRVLVTGAFGTLGRAAVRVLRGRGYDVRGLDLPTWGRRVAARRAGLAVVWGDLRDPAVVRAAVDGRDAVLHDAAILAPASERDPARSWAVNVDGTRALIAALEAGAPEAIVVYPSSVTVYGADPARTRPVAVEDPVVATDHYTRQKLACEALLHASRLRWVILRVGVAVDPGARRVDRDALRLLFDVAPDNRLEFVHPDDVACAQANALERPEACGRVWLVGGGPACRIRHRDLLAALFEALGLEAPPAAAFGAAPYYTDWMDTAASERLLAYQRRTFEDFRAEMAAGLAPARRLLRPARPLLRRWLLAHSRPWRERGGRRPA